MITDPRQLLAYEPDTGLFRWKTVNDGYQRAAPGDVAGGVDENGYVRIRAGGVSYRAHRLAFLLMGEDMPHQVDHINGKRSDNRWVNLRRADPLVNAKNAGK